MVCTFTVAEENFQSQIDTRTHTFVHKMQFLPAKNLLVTASSQQLFTPSWVTTLSPHHIFGSSSNQSSWTLQAAFTWKHISCTYTDEASPPWWCKEEWDWFWHCCCWCFVGSPRAYLSESVAGGRTDRRLKVIHLQTIVSRWMCKKCTTAYDTELSKTKMQDWPSE